jgi:glycosyltransferase involved in cell wall biosynthesis
MSEGITYAPIVLFVYNRPEHTKKTIESLKNNVGAEESQLFIYCDGAKNENAAEKVQQVRDYVSTVTGFKSVTVIRRDENYGLARSVITGVTEIVNRYGRVIVMEDDLLTGKYFLEYMNLALERYKDDKKAFSITGYSHFGDGSSNLPESYFIRIFSSWSWATWKDRWELFDENATGWERIINDEAFRKTFDYEDSFDMSVMLRNQMEYHTINSWAIRCYWAMFQSGGLTLFPNKGLCENIGFDGSGVHCSEEVRSRFATLTESRITQFPEEVSELPEHRRELIKIKHQEKRAYRRSRIRFYLTHPAQAVKKICKGRK